MKFDVNFDVQVPNPRERQRATAYAFGGCTSDLRSGSCAGCLGRCDRSFTQAMFCQMGVSTLISFSTKDSVVIMHGPVGCGSQSHGIDFSIKQYGAARGVKMEGARWLSTNLTETDVISGGNEKLYKTIIEADRRFRPTAIFVCNTCAPGVIGDDIESVVNHAQEQVTATVVPLHCPGFGAKVFSSAYDVVYHGIMHRFGFEPKKYIDYTPFDKSDPDYELKKQRYEYKKSRTVTLYNAWSIGPGDEKEIKRLLNALGINVNIFVEYKEPDDWRFITETALNVSFCHVHDVYFLEFLKREFGIPYILPTIPIGTEQTVKFIKAIAEFFGLEKEADLLLKKETEKLKKALEPIRKNVEGKKVLISGGFLRIGATGLLADEIGLKVVGFRNFNYDEFGDQLFSEVQEKIGDVQNAVSTQANELVNMVYKLKPDIAISHPSVGVWLVKAGVPSLTLFAQRFTYFGFTGAYSLAKRIERTLKNTAYARNISAHTKLPYQEQWYGKSPYHYITGLPETDKPTI
ncbi:nitrogenase component 1 [Ruminococcus albus]|uniref:Nitrogenase molybdenum-iron protein alpha chain n=1 Tax=Ruminococcus albus TaxID=1264 RepID=A0A1I1JMW5_RUMAL|nr:nitrogenase component 1 [Ruminococcus albus]SFC47253.1 nitrogenase molybdenum-iron protein alpha chain [Ruminococcus albus]